MNRRSRAAAFDPGRPGPYLKWCGNKAFLAAEKHVHHVPTPAPGGRWREPCVGSAGLFFSLPPERRRRAVLTDINRRVVGVHVAVRDHVEEVIRELAAIRETRHEAEARGPERVAEHYYRLRDLFNKPDLPCDNGAGGALMIALNHLCINGLFRENKDGEFNVAVGDYKKPSIFDPEHLRACSRALADADVRVLDVEAHCDEAEPGDGLFADPPYEPAPGADFTAYSAEGGDWAASSAQGSLFAETRTKRQRLADKLVELDARGVRFTLTDSDTPTTRDLYARFSIHCIQVPRSISRDGKGRQPATDLVVRNWP